MSVTFVIGGARSGKSRFAMQRAVDSGLRPVYVATSDVADDPEFASRVERHREDRGTAWTTIEEPLDLVGVMSRYRAPEAVLLVDCATLWVSNLMADGRDVEGEVAALCAVMRDGAGPVILVSNEVGQGIVPMNALAREFRDLQGLCNQELAELADEVRWMVAGIGVQIKG